MGHGRQLVNYCVLPLACPTNEPCCVQEMCSVIHLLYLTIYVSATLDESSPNLIKTYCGSCMLYLFVVCTQRVHVLTALVCVGSFILSLHASVFNCAFAYCSMDLVQTWCGHSTDNKTLHGFDLCVQRHEWVIYKVSGNNQRVNISSIMACLMVMCTHHYM
jgi:hypothetical protein